jgi:hypothetical protein
MTIIHLWQRAGKARRKAQVRRVSGEEVQTEARHTLLTHQRQQRDARERCECERLRRLMPEANLLTRELTAQILVARGLDA